MKAEMILMMWKTDEREVLIEKETLEIRSALSWAEIWEKENRDPQSFGKLYNWVLNAPLDYLNREQISEKEEKQIESTNNLINKLIKDDRNKNLRKGGMKIHGTAIKMNSGIFFGYQDKRGNIVTMCFEENEISKEVPFGIPLQCIVIKRSFFGFFARHSIKDIIVPKEVSCEITGLK